MNKPKVSTPPRDVVGAAGLADGGMPLHESPRAGRRIPASAVAARLRQSVREAGSRGLIFVARSEGQADEVALAFKHFAPEAQVVLLPPWDCLPYDRSPPSRDSMGRRAAALVALAQPQAASQRLVVMSVEAALQRVSPVDALAAGFTTLSVGQQLDKDVLQERLSACGYLLDDRVDEPGEFALLGQGADVFSPGAERPCRIVVEDGAITNIRAYNPATQRTEDDDIESVTLAPATELPDGRADMEPVAGLGMEARMLAADVALDDVFRLLPDAAIVLGPGADERIDAAVALIDDARLARDKQKGREPTQEHFYLDRRSFDAAIGQRRRELELEGLSPVPDFLVELNPAKAAAAFVAEQASENQCIVLSGSASDLNRLAKAVGRHLKQDIGTAGDWPEAMGRASGDVVRLEADIDEGFVDDLAALCVVAAADVFGTRLNTANRGIAGLTQEAELSIGDVVLHEDHGIGILRALETVEVEGVATDTVRLEYHGGTMLLAPVEEFGRIWRYGAAEDAVTLDRLKGDAWAKRRAQLDVEIDEAAVHLVRLAQEREEAGARLLKPPRNAYARFAARFPYPETADQSTAIAAVIDDLASGKAMNRLVCGDVGFGKTEVALRAAAVAALNGGQVAVVAPTTVLARQHFETFSRRFEGTDVAVGHLSRVVGDAEARSVKTGLADGSIGIVVATQAIAAKDVSFADLALVIIDEEHRFGVRLKKQLRELAPRLHVLSMSATPIPRTLAAAMVGVQEASLLATPPARRRPVRTDLAPYDSASVRIALIRENRRGGQSFCVVPRIEDIEPTIADLRKLVPDLSVLVAHGDMNAAEMDQAMVAFANGDGDILLSTNIIENGLDVPRANTIVIFRADRFGLAQLHQLRGRVGRGRAQGFAYLLTEPDREIAAETRSRLSTLEAFDRLGSGLAISARDLDLRGAGDLVGEDQAGHMKLIGVSLYQHLLARAVRKARGGDQAMAQTAIALGVSGAFPPDYVPEPVVRLNLYSRLQRIQDSAEIEAFEGELEDRFGELPEETTLALDLVRIRVAATAAGVAAISAGPAAIAIEFAEPGSAPWQDLTRQTGRRRSKDKLIVSSEAQSGSALVPVLKDLVAEVASLNGKG